MPAYNTGAISLKTAPFAEADKLVCLFTRAHGKIRAIAKGARRVPSRLGGRVEPFTYGDFFIARGRNLDIVSQVEIIESFQFIRESENILPAAFYVLRLVDAGTVDGQVNPELFDLLLHTLWRFKKNKNAQQVAKDFERDLVVLEGIHRESVDPRYILSEHFGRDLQTW